MKKLLVFSLAGLTMLASCKKDDDSDSTPTPTTPTTANLMVDIQGLEDLGSDFAYEGWIIVDGSPVSTGVFTVDGSGTLSKTTFTVDATQLSASTKFVLSIEPVPDNDPAPAPTKIMAGDFSGNSATLGTGTVGEGFDAASGKYIVAAPTGTGAMDEEFSGLWFLDNSSGSPAVGLNLPALAPGWKYEGWAVINGTPVTTGTFTAIDAADEGAPFSGSNPGPPFPGEDFLINAPSGLTFPTDIRGGTAVISIEPFPDNSPAPFTLKPLVSMIPATLPASPIDLNNNMTASFPTGSVSR